MTGLVVTTVGRGVGSFRLGRPVDDARGRGGELGRALAGTGWLGRISLDAGVLCACSSPAAPNSTAPAATTMTALTTLPAPVRRRARATIGVRRRNKGGGTVSRMTGTSVAVSDRDGSVSAAGTARTRVCSGTVARFYTKPVCDDRGGAAAMRWTDRRRRVT